MAGTRGDDLCGEKSKSGDKSKSPKLRARLAVVGRSSQKGKLGRSNGWAASKGLAKTQVATDGDKKEGKIRHKEGTRGALPPAFIYCIEYKTLNLENNTTKGNTRHTCSKKHGRDPKTKGKRTNGHNKNT